MPTPDYRSDPPPKTNLYRVDDVVTLEAHPGDGYVFENWTGDVTGIADVTMSVITFTMGDARRVVANYAAPSGTILYAVTVNSSPSSQGSVIVTTPCDSYTADTNQNTVSIRCPAGMELSLTATAFKGFRFEGWTGALSGSAEDATLLVDSPKAITATFVDSPEPTPFPWGKVVGGTAAALLVFMALVCLIRARARKAKDDQSA